MASIQGITFDCADPVSLSRFWAAVLDRPEAVDADEWMAKLPGDPSLLFCRVPEGKAAKNRVHIDLDVSDLAAERERLVALGATVVEEHDEYDGVHWITCRDPEGNEFCAAVHD